MVGTNLPLVNYWIYHINPSETGCSVFLPFNDASCIPPIAHVLWVRSKDYKRRREVELKHGRAGEPGKSRVAVTELVHGEAEKSWEVIVYIYIYVYVYICICLLCGCFCFVMPLNFEILGFEKYLFVCHFVRWLKWPWRIAATVDSQVAMFATIGYIVPEYWRLCGRNCWICEPTRSIQELDMPVFSLKKTFSEYFLVSSWEE